MMSKPIWDSIQLYYSGDEYFRDVIRAIEKAQSEVLVEAYIFDLDPIGHRVLQSLAEAAERGVACYLLMDGVGSFNWSQKVLEQCRANGILVRLFHPIPFHGSVMKRFSWKNFRRFLMLLKKMNKRNHRKVILIDGHRGFLGGLNVSQVHTKEFMGNNAWRDTGVQVQGEALELVRVAFFQAWRNSRFHPIPKALKIYRQLIRLNSSAKQRYSLLRDLNKRFRQAEKRILITNPYFIPRRSVLRSLIRAARRGVYVGLCLPANNDVPLVQWASRSLYARLTRAGVHLFEYQKQVLHAKTLVIDDWATVGSHNLNHRSLLHDLEVEVVLDDAKSIQSLIHRWDLDVQHSRTVTAKVLKMETWPQRILGRMAYWFRYWI